MLPRARTPDQRFYTRVVNEVLMPVVLANRLSMGLLPYDDVGGGWVQTVIKSTLAAMVRVSQCKPISVT